MAFDFLDLFLRLEEFLDKYVDIEDRELGEPGPNDAMQLTQDIREAITVITKGEAIQ